MSTKLDKVMESERSVQKEIEKAKLKAEDLINAAIAKATEEANQLHLETDEKIKDLLADKKQKIAKIDAELATVVKGENEKIVEKVSEKIVNIAEKMYKEVIRND